MEKFEEKILEECLQQVKILRERIVSISDGKIKELDMCEHYLGEVYSELDSYLHDVDASNDERDGV